MTRFRDTFGYLIGFALFVVGVPVVMWLVSRPVEPTPARVAVFVVLAACGLALSVWSIVHMRLAGKGNPMDAFNHELAPRTTELMTDGPYALCRNPMLLGVLVYYVGWLVLLASVGAAVVFAVFCVVMALQVRAEETRLAADFGDAYAAYCREVKRLIPHVW